MKKNYIKPEAIEVLVESQDMMATSPGSGVNNGLGTSQQSRYYDDWELGWEDEDWED